MDYDKERIHEALGLDKEELDAIIKKSIDAHNGVDGNLLAMHLASVTTVRTHCTASARSPKRPARTSGFSRRCISTWA